MTSIPSATDVTQPDSNVSNSVPPGVEQAAQDGHRLANEANGWAHHSIDAAHRSAELMRSRAHEWSTSTRSFIEHEPVKATLIAMFAGAAIVLLTSVLTRSRHH